MKIVDFIKGLLDSILSGSLERMRIINAMNDSFKEAYYSGELDRLCKVSMCARKGCIVNISLARD